MTITHRIQAPAFLNCIPVFLWMSLCCTGFVSAQYGITCHETSAPVVRGMVTGSVQATRQPCVWYRSPVPFGTLWLQDRIKYDALHRQGFFCRVESQLERKSGLAPRFRLGSLDYVNRLEGKMQK